jgi:hypothetical protein
MQKIDNLIKFQLKGIQFNQWMSNTSQEQETIRS